MLSKVRALAVVASVSALMACSSSVHHGSGSPSGTTLTGWVIWHSSMPVSSVYATPSALDPFAHLPRPLPYDGVSAQALCASSDVHRVVASSQVLVHGSNGAFLGAAAFEPSSLQNHQSGSQANPSSNHGSEFNCAEEWYISRVPAQPAYTVTFDGRSIVVNGSSADRPTFIFI
jgi:hypothetical protein